MGYERRGHAGGIRDLLATLINATKMENYRTLLSPELLSPSCTPVLLFVNLFRQNHARSLVIQPRALNPQVTPATGQGNGNDIAPMPQNRLPAAPTREETYPSPTKYTLAQWVGASSCVPSQRGSPGALGETWLWSLVHFWVASRGISRTPHLGYVI
jgi:hypothetical protein